MGLPFFPSPFPWAGGIATAEGDLGYRKEEGRLAWVMISPMSLAITSISVLSSSRNGPSLPDGFFLEIPHRQGAGRLPVHDDRRNLLPGGVLKVIRSKLWPQRVIRAQASCGQCQPVGISFTMSLSFSSPRDSSGRPSGSRGNRDS